MMAKFVPSSYIVDSYIVVRQGTMNESAERAASREPQAEGGPLVIRLAACGKFLYA
jgi:hypothetical protein